MYSLFKQALVFRESYNQPVEDALTQPGGFIRSQLLCMQAGLISEESKEFEEAISQFKDDPLNRECQLEVLKELSDIVFVCYQFAATYGLDLDTAMRRVFDSNMSKLGANGKPVYRSDGKVLKGPNYKPPLLEDLVPISRPQYDTGSK